MKNPRLNLFRDLVEGVGRKLYDLSIEAQGWRKEVPAMVLHRFVLAALLICGTESAPVQRALREFRNVTGEESLVLLLRQSWTCFGDQEMTAVCKAIDIDPLKVTDRTAWLRKLVANQPVNRETLELLEEHITLFGKGFVAQAIDGMDEQFASKVECLVGVLDLQDYMSAKLALAS